MSLREFLVLIVKECNCPENYQRGHSLPLPDRLPCSWNEKIQDFKMPQNWYMDLMQSQPKVSRSSWPGGSVG